MRNGKSSEAMELSSLLKEKIMGGNPLHDPTPRKAFQGVDAAFVNTNGSTIGEEG
jgi:hypothetical protein